MPAHRNNLIFQLEGKPFKLHYFTQGTGPAVLLLRGTGGFSDNSYTYLVKALSPNYLVISFAYPGFGGSSTLKQWTLENFEKIINLFLEQINAKEVTIIGHSIGAGIGIYFASKNPDKVKKIINTSPLISPFQESAIRGLFNAIRAANEERTLLRKMGKGNDLPVNFVTIKSLIYARQLLRLYGFIKKMNLEEELKALNTKVTTFIGAADKLINVQQEEANAKLLKHGKLIIYQDEGHYIIHNKVSEIIQAIKD